MHPTFRESARPGRRRDATEAPLISTELGSDLPTHVSDEDNRAVARELGELGKYSPANGDNRKPYSADVVVAASATEQGVTLLRIHDYGCQLRATLDELSVKFTVAVGRTLDAINDYELAYTRRQRDRAVAERDGRPAPHQRAPYVRPLLIGLVGLALLLMSVGESYIFAPRFAGIGVPNTPLLGTPITPQHIATFVVLIGLWVFGHLLARQHHDPADTADRSWREQLLVSLRGHRITLLGTAALLVAMTVIGASYFGRRAAELDATVKSLADATGANALKDLQIAQQQASSAHSAASPLAILALLLLSIGMVVAVRALTVLTHREPADQVQVTDDDCQDKRDYMDQQEEAAASIAAQYNGTYAQLETLALQAPVALEVVRAAAGKQIADIPMIIWGAHPEAESEPLFPFSWPSSTPVTGEQSLPSYVTDAGAATWLHRYSRLSLTDIEERKAQLRLRDAQRIKRLYDAELEQLGVPTDDDNEATAEAVDSEPQPPAPLSLVPPATTGAKPSARTRRFGAKRSRLIELLEAMPNAVDANPYELGTVLAPQLDAHVQTVRGWIRDWQDEQKAG